MRFLASSGEVLLQVLTGAFGTFFFFPLDGSPARISGGRVALSGKPSTMMSCRMRWGAWTRSRWCGSICLSFKAGSLAQAPLPLVATSSQSQASFSGFGLPGSSSAGFRIRFRHKSIGITKHIYHQSQAGPTVPTKLHNKTKPTLSCCSKVTGTGISAHELPRAVSAWSLWLLSSNGPSVCRVEFVEVFSPT